MRREIRNQILSGIVAAAYVICLIDPLLQRLRLQLMDEKEQQQHIEKANFVLFLAEHSPSAAMKAALIEDLRSPFNVLFFLGNITILIHLIYLAMKMVAFLVQLSEAAFLDLCNLKYLIKYDPESVFTFFSNALTRTFNLSCLLFGGYNVTRYLVKNVNNMLQSPDDSILNLDISRLFGVTGLLSHEPGFVCPITRKLFQDPVISFKTGFSYERSALVANNYICPITGERLTEDKIVINHTLKKLINELGDIVESENYSKTVRQFYYLFNNILQHLGAKLDIQFPRLSRGYALLTNDPLAPTQSFKKPVVLSDGFTYEHDYYEQLKARRSENPDIVLKSLFVDKVLTLEFVENKDLIKAIDAINDCLKPSAMEQAIVRPALAR